MKSSDSLPLVTPNEGIVTGKHIQAYTNCWEMTAVNPDGSVVQRGTWKDEVSFLTKDGTEVLRRVQHVYYHDKISVQEEEVFRENLKHIRLVIYTEGEEPHTDIHYDENRIWGKKIFRIAGQDSIEQMSVPFSYDLPQPVFDWHLWGVLISGFPLKFGYQARFLAHESYSSEPWDFRWFTLRVTGQEVIDGGKWGKVNCWIVEVQDQVLWKFWIAVKKDIAPVQQICIYNSDNVQFWWKPERKVSLKSRLSIIEAPSNLGLIEPAPGKEPGVAKLPAWLRTHGLYERLEPMQIIEVKAPAYSIYYDETTGVRNTAAIAGYSKQLSRVINKELKSGNFPLVIGGDCSILIGCALALKMSGNYGLFFTDGHTDFVPPHSSLTKGGAGMDLSIVTGYGHGKLTDIDGLRPYIYEDKVLAFGNRYMEKRYIQYIENSDINYYSLERARETGIEKVSEEFLNTMKVKDADGFWIHLDVDVLDDAIMPCVDSRQPGGLTYKELRQLLLPLLHSDLAVGMDITILDPDLDPGAIYTRQFIDELSEILKQ